MKPLITVSNLTKRFGDQTVVDQFSFEIQQNTSTALIGPNGAGKTTTFSMLIGLLSPTSGTVKMEGVKDPRKEIGFLPQYPQFFSWLTALEYTEMAAQLSGVPSRKARSEAAKMLEFVGLKDVLNKKIGTFSGGMKQRLGIAQAVVHQPKLLILDEPVSALDPLGRREIMNLLKELEQTTTILYSTHILNDAEEMTEQLLFLRKGKLVEQGSLQDVRSRFDEPRFKIQFAQANDALQFTLNTDLKATAEGAAVYVNIHHEKPTMQELMKQLANTSLQVVKIERVHASLEEIFMKVAGE